MSDLHLDCRDAWRRLRRTPGFTAVAVLTLALGIATTTTVFALIHDTLLKPIAGARLHDVFRLGQADVRQHEMPWLVPTFRDLHASLPSEVAAMTALSDWMPVVARVPGRADDIGFQGMSGDAAAFLELRAQAGRWIEPGDDRAEGAEPVAVISDRLWREWFGAAPDAVGSTIRLNDTAFRVIGVAARDFVGMFGGTMPTDVWVPLAQVEAASPAWVQVMFNTSGWRAGVLVRLAPDVPVETAAAALSARQATLTNGDVARVSLWPASTRPQLTFANERAVHLILLLSVVVLAGACANLANMLYARHAARVGDFAVRVSLGASRIRLLRHALVESITIGVLASLIGVVVSLGAIAAFDAAMNNLVNVVGVRFAFDVGVDRRVLLYGTAAGVLSGMLVGVLAALQTTRVPPLRLLAGSAGTTTGLTPAARRVRMGLVAVQVTAAVVLVMSTGVIFERTREATDEGVRIRFDSARLTAGQFRLGLDGYHEAQGRDLFDRVVQAARNMAGVEQAAIVDALPGSRSSFYRRAPSRVLLTEDSQREIIRGRARRADAQSVSGTPGVFDTLGLRITRGRGFLPSDGDGAPLVAVLSESAAEALWPGADAVGRSLRIGGQQPWVTVIGVVEDPVSGHHASRVYETSEDAVSIRPSNFIFTPFAQRYSERALILVRSQHPAAQVDALRAMVLGIDEHVGLFDVGVASKMLDWLGPFRVVAVLVTTLGLVALAIAMLGVYGVVSYFVSTRTREIGIRMTLGATPRGVMKMVLDYAVRIMLVGLLPGVFVASIGRACWRRPFSV